MIIKKVIMNDFFRYYGKQEIDCSINEKENVVVIIVENGRGKTTFLNAFNWLFYNELIKPLTLENVLNYRRKKEMKIGDTVQSYVSVVFTEAGKDYRIKRVIEFRKESQGETKLLYPKAKLEIYRVDKNGNEVSLDSNIAMEKLIIPKDLRGFFFFDGEHISRLSKVDGKKEIKKAILNVLGITYLDRSISDLKVVKDKYMYKRKRFESDSVVEVGLIAKHTNLKRDIEKIEDKEKQIRENLDKANIEYNRLVKLISLSDVESVKAIEKENKKLQSKLNTDKESLKIKEKKIKNHISNNFKYYLLYDFTEYVEKILEEKKQEGKLPSTIKETFIDDLINRKECICGAEVCEGSKEYNALLELKTKAGSKELDDAYYELKYLIRKIKEQKESFYEVLDDLNDEREVLKNEIYLASEKLKINSEKLEKCGLIEIEEAQKSKSMIESQIDEYKKRLGVLEEELKGKNKELKECEKGLSIVKTNNNEINELNKKINIVDELLNLNDDFKDMFTDIVREELDKRIKDVYAKISNKSYRVPVLTKKFELKVMSTLNGEQIEDENQKEEILSTGEEQITSLSFIGALVAFAKDTKDDSILSKLTGEDYPIVMDSPFGNLDEAHTSNVAANIGQLASQVIIVVSRKQWEGYVEKNIEKQVVRAYKMIDGDKINESGEYTIIREVGI